MCFHKITLEDLTYKYIHYTLTNGLGVNLTLSRYLGIISPRRVAQASDSSDGLRMTQLPEITVIRNKIPRIVATRYL